MKRKLGFIAAFMLVSAGLHAQNPILDIESGKIEGVAGQNGITVYKGIPYAAPPVGDLRWKKPQPAPAWQGIRKCDEFGAASLQSDQTAGTFYWKEFYQEGDPKRSEDCLYLNVWTPAAGTDARLPVIFWIHGGAYMGGYGHEVEFDGNAYAQKGVILVTINYRLGMCGFLSHPLLTAENGGRGSGNYGLFDQQAALRWVKRNIAAFGGDPDNITVMGQSAGAGSVQALVSSPLTKGYIRRAIIQSGGGLGGIIAAKPLAEAEQTGKAMWDEAGAATLEQMREWPAERFQEVLMKYMMKQQKFSGLPYSPCIDGELLTAPMNDVAKAGEAADISYMIGFTSEDISPEVMKKAAVEWSLLQESLGRQPAYVYCFCRDLPGEDMAQAGGFGEMKGAFHSSELWYMFGTLGKCWRPMGEGDYELSERMVSYWTNFARTGDPNGASLPEWRPCTQDEPYIQPLDVVAPSTQEVYKNDDLTVSLLEEKTWVVETKDMTTMYILEGNDRAMLIDTGTKCTDLDKVVRKITDKPLYVVITHNHVDHAGNIGYFDEVYMHPADKDVRSTPFGGKYNWIQDGHVFDLGGRKVEVVLMPGHTPGSIVLLDKSRNACYSGDAFGSGQVWLQLRPHVPMRTYYESCVRMERIMKEQGITKIYCGHYPYFRKALHLSYITEMKDLAERICSGAGVEAAPYKMSDAIDIASETSVYAVNGTAMIVYDAENIN